MLQDSKRHGSNLSTWGSIDAIKYSTSLLVCLLFKALYKYDIRTYVK